MKGQILASKCGAPCASRLTPHDRSSQIRLRRNHSPSLHYPSSRTSIARYARVGPFLEPRTSFIQVRLPFWSLMARRYKPNRSQMVGPSLCWAISGTKTLRKELKMPPADEITDSRSAADRAGRYPADLQEDSLGRRRWENYLLFSQKTTKERYGLHERWTVRVTTADPWAKARPNASLDLATIVRSSLTSLVKGVVRK